MSNNKLELSKLKIPYIIKHACGNRFYHSAPQRPRSFFPIWFDLLIWKKKSLWYYGPCYPIRKTNTLWGQLSIYYLVSLLPYIWPKVAEGSKIFNWWSPIWFLFCDMWHSTGLYFGTSVIYYLHDLPSCNLFSTQNICRWYNSYLMRGGPICPWT